MDLRILVRCDGSEEVGMGHVVRCLALADELSEMQGAHVQFALREGPIGLHAIEARGYQVIAPSPQSELDPGQWLCDTVEREDPDVLVMDIRDDTALGAVESIRSSRVLVVTIDDPSERRLEADLAFYPPVPQAHVLEWPSFSGELHIGWEWILLRRDLLALRGARRTYVARTCGDATLLVTMGGSDPKGLTFVALDAVDALESSHRVRLVVGPAFAQRERLERHLESFSKSIEVLTDVDDLPALMSESDLALASFGVTAYELAALGVPAVYLCLSPDHAEAAMALVQEGAASSFGYHADIEKMEGEKLAKMLGDLLTDAEGLRLMGQRGSKLVDGLGAQRIAERIVASSSLGRRR